MPSSRHYRNRSDRRRFWPPFPTVQTIITYTIAAGTGNKLRLTFSAPVSVPSIPTFRRIDETLANLPNPTAYTVVSPTVVDFTYAADPTGTNCIGFFADNDPNIRGTTGGFVSAQPVAFIAA